MNGRRGSLTGADIAVGALMSLAALVHAGEHVLGRAIGGSSRE